MKTKTVHYLNKTMSISKDAGIAACGIYISRKGFGDDMTANRQDVTCGNCKRSKIFRQMKSPLISWL